MNIGIPSAPISFLLIVILAESSLFTGDLLLYIVLFFVEQVQMLKDNVDKTRES